MEQMPAKASKMPQVASDPLSAIALAGFLAKSWKGLGINSLCKQSHHNKKVVPGAYKRFKQGLQKKGKKGLTEFQYSI